MQPEGTKQIDDRIGVGPDLADLPVSIRTPSVAYLSAGFVVLFVSAFLVYLELDLYAITILTTAVVAIPVLALTDRIIFDGRRIRRTGLFFRFSCYLLGRRDRLKVSDIEQVDTQSLRVVNRGGNIIYRFRTTFRGKGTIFPIAAGGDRYRKFVQNVLRKLDSNVLDTRSIELRNYLDDPDAVRLRANISNIPPSDVIEPIFSHRSKRDRERAAAFKLDPGEAVNLRQIGNQLRLTGAVVRALEAFRRALVLSPYDPWLLFDSARCLYSFSGARRDPRLERKAIAMMRLAERRAGTDSELLSLIGESYSQMGEWDRAASVFRRISETVGASFRSLRGQAEIALREGKIAHVIHNFAEANRISTTESLRRWTQTEVDYFSRLNQDEEYMELEVSRVNLVDSLVRFRRTALRIVLFGTVLVITGVALEEYFVANAGWAISILAIAIWIAMHFGRQMLEARIPFELVDEDRE